MPEEAEKHLQSMSAAKSKHVRATAMLGAEVCCQRSVPAIQPLSLDGQKARTGLLLLASMMA